MYFVLSGTNIHVKWLILEFTVSGPYDFQMDILNNFTKFKISRSSGSHEKNLNPRPPKGGGLLQFFLPNKLHPTLLGNHFYILYASFDVCEVEFWGIVWVWGSSKRMVEGGWWNPMTFICPFLKYLTRYMLQTSYAHENHHFLTYSAKTPAKIPCFNNFLAKNWFLLIFTYTSYEDQCSFWYQWIEEVHTYTLVPHIGVSGVPYRKSREGVATTPLFGGRVTKNTSGGQGLSGNHAVPYHTHLGMFSLGIPVFYCTLMLVSD